MFKNRLNYNLINITLICIIVFFIYISGNLWITLFKLIYKIVLPFMVAFFVAYMLNPFLNYLIQKKIPKSLSIILIILTFIALITFISITVFPSLYSEIISLINYIISFINKISIKYNINFFDLEEYLYDIIKNIGQYISNSTINLIKYSIDYLTNTLIISTLSIYFLIDMNKIRNLLKKFFFKNYRSYDCMKLIDNELNKYFIAFFKIMIISFFEYSIIYIIIGHPNAVILGVLVAILGIIPYIGGVITNVIAGITAFSVGTDLFIKTLISFLILSVVDSYVINPIVYGKSNKIHPVIIIFSVLTGGILGGVMGMIVSLPLTIIVVSILKFYHSIVKK